MSKQLIPIKSNLSFFMVFLIFFPLLIFLAPTPTSFFIDSSSFPFSFLIILHVFLLSLVSCSLNLSPPFPSPCLLFFISASFLIFLFTGLKIQAFWPIRTPSRLGLWCWVTSRGQGRRLPTGWDHSVARETVSHHNCLVTADGKLTKIILFIGFMWPHIII